MHHLLTNYQQSSPSHPLRKVLAHGGVLAFAFACTAGCTLTTEEFESESETFSEAAVQRNEPDEARSNSDFNSSAPAAEIAEASADESASQQDASEERPPRSEAQESATLDDSFGAVIGDDGGSAANLGGEVNETPPDDSSPEAPEPAEPADESASLEEPAQPADAELEEPTSPEPEVEEELAEQPVVPPLEPEQPVVEEPVIPDPVPEPPVPVPQPSCDGEVFGQSCYLLFDQVASWQGAEDQCVSLGGHLASANTPQEDTFLSGWPSWLGLGVDGSGVWLGGIDLTGAELFVWADGTSVNFNGWEQDQPNNGPGYNCIEKRNDGSNAWFDLSCNDQRRFVCELPR